MAAIDPLRIPFVVSARVVEDAVRGGPDRVEEFLRPLVDQIERAWKRGARVESVMLACSSLRSALKVDLPTTESWVRLTLVTADAMLAAARSTEDADAAFDLAESAQLDLSRLHPPSPRHLDLLSESMLVAAVALKAIGMFDESIDYMRLQVSDRRLDDVEAISLERQQVMMFQSAKSHLALLVSADAYRTMRPLEYFRTLKRVVEFLLSAGHIRAATDIAPELGRAYLRASPDLSALGHVSFFKNVAQIAAAHGDSYRALRLLYVCERLALVAGFAGQLRQVRSLMASIEGNSRLALPTFALPRG